MYEFKTYRMTADELAKKAALDEYGSERYHWLAYPLNAEIQVGNPKSTVGLTYKRHLLPDAREDQEYQLFPEVDRKKTPVEQMFGGADPIADYYRSVREYEAEELRLAEHGVPEVFVPRIVDALAENLQTAVDHLEALGIAAGANAVYTRFGIEYWLTAEALRIANEENKWRECIRIITDEIKYRFAITKVLA